MTCREVDCILGVVMIKSKNNKTGGGRGLKKETMSVLVGWGVKGKREEFVLILPCYKL